MDLRPLFGLSEFSHFFGPPLILSCFFSRGIGSTVPLRKKRRKLWTVAFVLALVPDPSMIISCVSRDLCNFFFAAETRFAVRKGGGRMAARYVRERKVVE